MDATHLLPQVREHLRRARRVLGGRLALLRRLRQLRLQSLHRLLQRRALCVWPSPSLTVCACGGGAFKITRPPYPQNRNLNTPLSTHLLDPLPVGRLQRAHGLPPRRRVASGLVQLVLELRHLLQRLRQRPLRLGALPECRD